MTRWWAAFPGKRPAGGSFSQNSTHWRVNRRSSLPIYSCVKLCQEAITCLAGDMNVHAAAQLPAPCSFGEVTH